MLRGGMVIAACVALAGCGEAAADRKLTAELLNDPAALQRIGNELEPADREAFGRYLVGRAMSSAMGSPPLVNSERKDPATVREAVALQKWSDTLLAEMKAAQEPHQEFMRRSTGDTPVADYNAAVAASNRALAKYQEKLSAGPPAGL